VWSELIYRVELREGARRAIERLAKESQDGSETGGILLGHGPEADGHIQVETAGDPGPHADRRPDYFLRDLQHAQQLAERAWEKQKAIWIGEWHTHPMGGEAPSPVDLATYARLLSLSTLEFDVFVSVIVVPHARKSWEKPQLHPWVLSISQIPASERPRPST
jgi:integrative and conjugative element protein (TIGR02256 family)